MTSCLKSAIVCSVDFTKNISQETKEQKNFMTGLFFFALYRKGRVSKIACRPEVVRTEAWMKFSTSNNDNSPKVIVYRIAPSAKTFLLLLRPSKKPVGTKNLLWVAGIFLC